MLLRSLLQCILNVVADVGRCGSLNSRGTGGVLQDFLGMAGDFNEKFSG